MTNPFTLEFYQSLLKGKKTLIIADYAKYQKGIIVRHDIDFDLVKAYEFSEFEKSLNINSTYYLLLTSPLYNPFSEANSAIIKKMIKNGFEIGLHFDPMVYENNHQNLDYHFHKEVAMFECFFETKLLSYSQHQPSVKSHQIKTDLIDAYSPDIFSDDCYLSDSCFDFRGKNPQEFLQKSDVQLVQFLTHPAQWSEKGGLSYNPLVNHKLNLLKDDLYQVFKFNQTFNNQKNGFVLHVK
jgi:hypothetical protein